MQGRHTKIIIVSMVRSNKWENTGFTQDWKRLNVMMTRAQYGFIVVADAATMRGNEIFREYLRFGKEQGVLVPSYSVLGPAPAPSNADGWSSDAGAATGARAAWGYVDWGTGADGGYGGAQAERWGYGGEPGSRPRAWEAHAAAKSDRPRRRHDLNGAAEGERGGEAQTGLGWNEDGMGDSGTEGGGRDGGGRWAEAGGRGGTGGRGEAQLGGWKMEGGFHVWEAPEGPEGDHVHKGPGKANVMKSGARSSGGDADPPTRPGAERAVEQQDHAEDYGDGW